MQDVTLDISVHRAGRSQPPTMVWIPRDIFRMGSDRHYPEEAPVHRVSVSGFWIDRTAATNRKFKVFVQATGHVTFAKTIPNPENCSGAPPHMLYAGSLLFTPPRWTADWWSAKHDGDAAKACCVTENPRGGPETGSNDPCQLRIKIPRKVIKGGSHLCAPNYCRRYRPPRAMPSLSIRPQAMSDSAVSFVTTADHEHRAN